MSTIRLPSQDNSEQIIHEAICLTTGGRAYGPYWTVNGLALRSMTYTRYAVPQAAVPWLKSDLDWEVDQGYSMLCSLRPRSSVLEIFPPCDATIMRESAPALHMPPLRHMETPILCTPCVHRSLALKLEGAVDSFPQRPRASQPHRAKECQSSIAITSAFLDVTRSCPHTGKRLERWDPNRYAAAHAAVALDPLCSLPVFMNLELSLTGIYVSEQNIWSMAHSWPRIARLDIRIDSGGIAVKQGNLLGRAPANSFVAFATHCPRFETLVWKPLYITTTVAASRPGVRRRIRSQPLNCALNIDIRAFKETQKADAAFPESDSSEREAYLLILESPFGAAFAPSCTAICQLLLHLESLYNTVGQALMAVVRVFVSLCAITLPSIRQVGRLVLLTLSGPGSQAQYGGDESKCEFNDDRCLKATGGDMYMGSKAATNTYTEAG
ncbi:hypothetical protein NUW54_g9266 [Trametes sanguinea]|nr:hypothetical protein NUW54_g9266 [Trametes sanguinea]